MKNGNRNGSWSSYPGASRYLNLLGDLKGETMTEIGQNQNIIVVRNQAIETRYPGGMAAFVEKYSPTGNELTSAFAVADQKALEEAVKDIESNYINTLFNYGVFEIPGSKLSFPEDRPHSVEFNTSNSPKVEAYLHVPKCKFIQVVREDDSVDQPRKGKPPKLIRETILQILGWQRKPFSSFTMPPRMTRRQAIRARCLDCSAFSPKDVRECAMTDCPLHPFRMGVGQQSARERSSAIRAYCLECCSGQLTEVRKCPSQTCSLYPYRHYKVDRSAEIVVTIKEPARIRFQDIPVDAELAALVESPTLIPRIALKEAFRQQRLPADWLTEGGAR